MLFLFLALLSNAVVLAMFESAVGCSGGAPPEKPIIAYYRKTTVILNIDLFSFSK